MGNGVFTAGTTGQTVDAIERVALPSRQIDFSPNSMLMGYTLGGQTFGAVPPSLTLTSVTLYDLTDLGTGGTLGAASLPTVSLYGKQGTELLGTANHTGAGEPVLVRLADGSEVSLTPVTYTFVEKNLTLDGTATYRLTLNAAGVTPILPLFTNAATKADSGFDLTDVAGYAPFLSFTGTVSVTDVAVRAEGKASLATLLDSASFSDSADRIVTVTLAQGAQLTLDRSVKDATLIFEAEGAAAVAFVETALTCPFVFRNATGVDNGLITLSGPWDDVETNDDRQLWQPDSLAIDCDVNVASPLPRIVSGWFQQKSVRVLPGRTLRLTSEAETAARLPFVALTAPTANLAFADTEKAAASAEKPSIPEKYLPLFTGTSGTITFERPVVFAPTGNENDSNGSIFRIGNQGKAGYNFTLNVDETFSSTPRLVLGGKSGSATLNLRGDEATPYAAVINFDTGSTLTQKAGALTLGNADWATKFVGDSATLVFGDGDTKNGLATATLFGIPYGVTSGGVTTDYRGAADLTVKADATLLLNECDLPAVAGTPDYALYPVGKRSLKVQGGTVKANTGAVVTMAFESPETQTAPIAVAPVPGLEVIGSANLESFDTTASSLTLDALKGNGSVAFSGRVNVGAVRVEEGKTLSLDLRKGTDGADDALGGSAVALGAVSGSAGTVRFGLLGDGGTSGEQAVIDSLLAGGFTGTVGFLMPDYPTVDFEATRLPALPFSLEVQPGQTVVMRLDQYADADILWPEDCSNVKLVLVEAGPFGGEASLPAWPQGVMMEFHRYDDSSDGHSALPGEDYDAIRNDDGLTIDLTWKDPVLTGKVAWIDVEFNGDSYNTGWFHLGPADGSKNGMLAGWTSTGLYDGDELIKNEGYFVPMYNPSSQGLSAYYNPYINPEDLEYPESWSLVTRIIAPDEPNTVMLAIGSNYQANATSDGTKPAILALTTGTLKENASDDNAADEIILWLIPENSTEGMRQLASVKVPLVTAMPHLVTILCDKEHIQIYFDGYRLINETLPAGTRIGPGLQAGALIGGANVDETLKERFAELRTGTQLIQPDAGERYSANLDFIRIYRGILTESAIDRLVRDNPYIHREWGRSHSYRDVRYRRVLEDGAVEDWVQEGAWVREHSNVQDDAAIWNEDGTYAEPAEGAIVVIEVPKGSATLCVNTTKHDLFPSANRVYASLIVSGQEESIGVIGIDRYTPSDDWTGGQLILVPTGYTAENAAIDKSDWEQRADDGEFLYGTFRFSGGAGQRVNLNSASLGKFFTDSRPDAAYFLTDTRFYASVADFNAKDGVSVNNNVTVRAYVDDSMLRDVDEELVVRQITGPVSGCDGGYGAWERNTSVSMATDHQKSDYVYPDRFDERVSAWLFDDATLEYNPGLETYNEPPVGLFVRCLKIPGRLYLELNKSEILAGGALSEQDWYRYGYKGDDANAGISRITPKPMNDGDFEKAIALSIRLEDGTTKTLYTDAIANGLTINELTIDKPKADDGMANETLQILPQDGTGYSLKVMEAVSTERRLEVYSAQGAGSEASATGADGVKLHAVYDEATETNIGAKLYGIETGAFVAGNSSINHALDGSSIARIESEGTIRFTAAQDLSATTVAAAENASVEQTGAENAFRVAAIELARESCLTFASNAATVDGAITLTGNATIEGTGMTATLTPTEGIRGQTGTETLTLAAENASWKLLNSEVGGLPLTKTGAGTADIATDLPPNAGKVDVREGTLRVATGLAGEGQAVGRAGLNVEQGATLAPTPGTVGTDVLAEIPAGQTVSGLGRIDGTLRLEADSGLDATEVPQANDASLSVRDVQTDGLTALADVGVSLPDGASGGLVFLRSDETTLNWAARARLLATDPAKTRWDVLLRYRRNAEEATEGTNYLVGAAGLSVPDFDGIPDDIPEADRPSKDEADKNNKWPDGSGDETPVDDELTDQIQGGGNVAGKAEGYTMANHKWLMAPDIANAYACFGNVWVLAPRTTDKQREDYATRDLLMAYEFGISRMAFVENGTRIVVEAKLRNALKDCPYFTDEQRQGAGAFKPSYLPGVRLTIDGPNGPLTGVTEITDEAVIRSYGFSPDMPTTEVARWFLVPYPEDNFPAGESAHLTVRAIPPSEPAAPPAAE